MTENKRLVEKYMEGFRRSDHEMILSCLTDDVVWDLPGAFHLVGKVAFEPRDREPGVQGEAHDPRLPASSRRETWSSPEGAVQPSDRMEGS